MKNKIILFVLGLILSIGTIQAQVARSLNVATAGTLSTLIKPSEKYQITSLTLTGNLNGDDIRYIREMAGRDVKGDATSGNLYDLDLSGANIVSGGSYYFNGFIASYTSNNSLSQYMFEYCTRLTSITIPNSVTYIGFYAFYGCTGLTSVTITSGVTSIGGGAFYGCTGLTSVTIPTGVTSIEEGAFRICTGLTSVTIPNSVTSIGRHVFEGCTGLTSITIPVSVTSLGERVFNGCTGLVQIVVDSSNTQYSSLDGVLFNKNKTLLIAYPARKSGQYTIPGSVTSINDYTFSKCTGLTSVSIPNSVVSIGNNAFESCTGLTSITIPNSVTFIGECAFYGCTGLTSVTIPSSITSIADYVFSFCSGLTSVTIPGSVTSIGNYAFFYCKGLTSFSIPGSVTSLGERVFNGCTRLTQIIVDSNNSQFSSLDGVLFNKNNTLLITHPGGKSGQYSIPGSVTSIGNDAFTFCEGLTSVTIPNSVSSIGNNAFYFCTKLTTVTIPNSVTSIKDFTFFYCSGLTSFTIPSGVTSIGRSAFAECGLTSVTIPSNVTSIGETAFYSCTRLNETHCQMKTPPTITSNVFQYVNKNTCKLYVPKGTSQSYKQSDVWKDFVNILEEDVTPINKISLYKASVCTLDNAIIVQNANGETISVYTPSGALLKTVKASDDFIKIELPENQIYLVKIANNTYKVALN